MAPLTPPTATDLRADPRIDWVGMGLPAPTPPAADPLTDEVILAWAYVEEKTGRDLDSLDAASNLGVIGKRAVVLRVIQQAVQGRGAFITREIDNQIRSFSVPGYSETRESSSSAGGRWTKFQAAMFNDWPILNDLLWLLATPAKRDEAFAMFLGEDAPASAITAVAWSGRRSGVRGDPFYYG